MAKNKAKELSLPQLRVQLVQLGISKEDAESFDVATAKATIKAMKAKGEVDSKVQTLNPTVSPNQKRRDEAYYRSKAGIMEKKLAGQEKIRFQIPLDIGEKPGVVKVIVIKGRKEIIHVSGAVAMPIMNGYKMIIPKGVYVNIPVQVADLLSKAHDDTQKAGSAFLSDRSTQIQNALD